MRYKIIYWLPDQMKTKKYYETNDTLCFKYKLEDLSEEGYEITFETDREFAAFTFGSRSRCFVGFFKTILAAKAAATKYLSNDDEECSVYMVDDCTISEGEIMIDFRIKGKFLCRKEGFNGEWYDGLQ